MREETNRIGKERFDKKEPGLKWFWKSSAYQIEEDAKMKTFTVRKAFSGEKAKVVARKPFANISDQKVRVFGHTKSSLKRWTMWLRSPQPSQQKPRTEIGLSRKDLSRASCLTQWLSMTYTWDPQGSWEWGLRTKTARLDWRDGESEIEGSLVDLQNSTVRKHADMMTQLRIRATFPEKGKMALRVQPWAQRAGSSVHRRKLQAPEDYSQVLKCNGISWTGFWNCLRPVAPFSSNFFSLFELEYQ